MGRRAAEADAETMAGVVGHGEPDGESSDTDGPVPDTNTAVDTSETALTQSEWPGFRKFAENAELLFDVALVLEGKADDVTLDNVLFSYNVSREDYERAVKHHIVKTRLDALRRDIAENGLSFRRKAAALAEKFLPLVSEVILDVDTPPHVKLQGVGQLVKWGNLEPKTNIEAGGGITVQINFSGDAKPYKVIEGEVIEKQEES